MVWRSGRALQAYPPHCRPLEGASPPPRLRDLNYVFLYEDPKVKDSGFGTGLKTLVASLNTDFDWLREHTRYLQRATEWDSGGRPANRLLSGDDIAEAKDWAARRPKSAPEPTSLHLDFIRASEEEAEARSSAQRKQLEAMAAAQAECQKALHEAEEAQRKRATNEGNAEAMFNLGLLYANGQGVTQDYVRAREWYEKAAEKGFPRAMFNLGLLYANGEGVTQDYAKAREWYEKAADKGNAIAMVNLGLIYAHGQGVTQDYTKAREWYEKAADKGDAEAKANLEKLPIMEANGAGRYAEALQLQETLAARVEAVETERAGKPGEETEQALISVTWYALLAREFTKALTVADRAHALLPDDLSIETNRAHALMFLERGEEAQALYLAYKGKPVSEQDAKLWERVIAEDFAEFRKAGLTHPMMADIEKALGVSP